jgi:hypothetical protein
MADSCDNDTVTETTGTGVTVTATLPVLPSLVALIVAAPGLTAVTTPSVDTVAVAGASVAHAIDRPLSADPCASNVCAAIGALAPTTNAIELGATVTDATGITATVILAAAVFPSLVAVIVAVPAETAETRPVEETLATAIASELHVTSRPAKALPVPSFTDTVS